MPARDEAFCYTPFNLAVVINNRRMNVVEIDDFLAWVFDNEKEYLQAEYRDDSQKLMIATLQYVGYLHNRKDIKEERSAIAKDYKDTGIQTSANEFFFAEIDPHHFLKNLRLRILYFNKNRETRTTLRQILEHYGYRRRNHKIIEEIEEYLSELNLAFVDNGRVIDLFDIKLDDRLVLEIRE